MPVNVDQLFDDPTQPKVDIDKLFGDVPEISIEPRIVGPEKRPVFKKTRLQKRIESFYEAQRRALPLGEKVMEPFISPEEYSFHIPGSKGPYLTKKTGTIPLEVSPVKEAVSETLSELPQRGGEFLASLPTQFLELFGAEELSKLLKLPGLIEKLPGIDRLGEILTKVGIDPDKASRMVEELAKQTGTGTTFGAVTGASEGAQKPSSGPLETAENIALGTAKGVAINAPFFGITGAATELFSRVPKPYESTNLKTPKDVLNFSKTREVAKASDQLLLPFEEPKTPAQLGVKPKESMNVPSFKKFEGLIAEGEKDPVTGQRKLEQVLQESGVDHDLIQEGFDKVTKEPVFARKAKGVVEHTIENGDIAPQTIQVSRSGKGGVDVVRGPGDLNAWDQYWFSPATVAWKNPELRPVVMSGYLAKKRMAHSNNLITQEFRKPLKALPKDVRMKLGEILQEEDIQGVRVNPEELDKLGPKGKEMYGKIRNALQTTGQTFKKMGVGMRDPGTYNPRVWIGDLQIHNSKGHFLDAARNEGEAFQKIEALLKAHPKETFTVAPRFEFPQDLHRLDPRRKFAKAMVDNFEEERISADNFLEKKRVGRFFGNVEERKVHLQSFEKDPAKSIPSYLYGAQRKMVLDEFEQEASKTLAKLDPSSEKYKFVKDYIESVRGKPMGSDMLLREAFSKMNVPKAILQKTLNAIYRFNVFDKLWWNYSGPLLHTLQGAVDTNAVLGPQYTARGIQEMLNVSRGTGKNLATNLEVLSRTGADMPFSDPRFYSGAVQAQKQKIWGPMWAFQAITGKVPSFSSLGAYWQAVEKLGMSHDEAIEYAWNQMARVTPEFSVAAFNPAARSQAFSVLAQFRHWIVKQAEFMSSMSPKEAMRLAGTVVAGTGVSAIPGIQGTETVRRFKTKHPQLSRGALGLMGIDVSEHLYPFFFETPAKLLSGGLVSELQDVGQVLSPILHGEHPTKESLEKLKRQFTPGFIRKPLDVAERLATGEYRSPITGELITKITPKEALTSFLFTPTRIAQARDIKESIREDQKSYKEQHHDAIQKLVDGDELNDDDRANLNPKTLKRSILEEMMRRQHPQVFRELQKLPVQMREEYLDNLSGSGALE